jgi:hypothetical protein
MIELRRHVPGIMDNAVAKRGMRAIADRRPPPCARR